jgi:hypothetical protein
MIKKCGYLLFVVAFICSLSTYLITSSILVNGFETEKQKLMKELNIEKQELMNELNDKKENVDLQNLLASLNSNQIPEYDLVNEFTMIHSVHLPLYEIERGYDYSKKIADSDTLLAVSIKLKGTYKVNQNLLCNVYIIKDITSENSGFIHSNRSYYSNVLQDSTFYHNGVYIVYSFESLNPNEFTITAEDDLFIQKFFDYYTQITH